MNKMQFFIVFAGVLSVSGCLLAQELKTIKLNPPDKKRGLPFMETLAVKASANEWSDKELSLQDLSDLLWAANGLNRPEEKKTTASSAQNAHDVDIYVFMKEGVYVYDIYNHELDPVLSGDFRSQLMMPRPPRPAGAPGSTPTPAPPSPPPPSNPPIQIILVSDSERFRMGPPELRYEWGAIDAGIISQNISLFCAATGLKTRPRASMDKEKIKNLLKLKDTQYVLLNHPVGYAK
ncbi:MAG: nitroreductase family protein [candidate division KSB1 bacterium]|nr:nitroreductase family protein [candidate division KSB1 bacterium]